jgi:phosphoglycerate-specific signal transduction histidine kinase
MVLAEFIRNNLETILQEWEQFADSIQPKTGDLDKKALRNHTEDLLKNIAEDLATPQGKHEQSEKSKGHTPKSAHITFAEKHGQERFHTDFLITDVIAEYRFMRATILRLWSEHNPSASLNSNDLIRFNEALDQQIFEAAGSFQVERDELEQKVKRHSRKLQEAQEQYLHAAKLSAIGHLSASIAH